MDERQKKIVEGLADAEQRASRLRRRRSRPSCRRRGTPARHADHSQAEQRAAQMIEEAKNAARTEGARQIAAAKAEIEQQMTNARDQLRAQVALLAVAGAEKILRSEVNAQAHAELLKQLREQLR